MYELYTWGTAIYIYVIYFYIWVEDEGGEGMGVFLCVLISGVIAECVVY